MSQPSAAAPIRRRRVHYVSGFDPRGAGHYHRLFREQGARPQPGGALVNTGTRQRSDTDPHTHRWPVQWTATPAGEDPAAPAVFTEQVFMGWDDIIRAHWSRQPLGLLREMVMVYRAMLCEIGLGRLHRTHPTALLTGVLPAAGMLLALLAGVGMAWAIASAAESLPTGWRLVLATLSGLAAARGMLALADRLGLFWLTRIYGFVRALPVWQKTKAMVLRLRRWLSGLMAGLLAR